MSTSLHQVKSVDKSPIKKILKDKKKRIRLFFLVSGLLLAGLGFYLSKPTKSITSDSLAGKNSSSEVISFSQEPVNIDKSLLDWQKNKQKVKSPPIRIIIPELEINLPIKEARVVKGYWEVFPDSAGFGLGSAYPDELGNQVIFAHARRGLFLPLKEAKGGENIYLLTSDKWFSYKISEIKEVSPSQTEVIVPTTEITLTLYTCSGFADSKRLIIIAKRV